ncbi:tubulin polyglutamylase TTLL5 [Engraulis encrasicolus]|uniref:tubulin polyglutamylase TTLL5 n=1 Tax=Engraulis encrasicolus TaxID=184585 RepID=UPI002FD0374A
MPSQTWAMDDAQEDANIKDIVCVSWSGTSRRTPVLLFHAEVLVTKDGSIRTVGEHYNLAFKIVRTESRLVRGILTNHGFHEVHPNSNDFNIMWTGSHLKPYLFRSLQGFQKVNHFPRSYELTRKDRLYKNIQRMQQAHGYKHFHFIPQTFILPSEYSDFCTSFSKDKEPWIIKPVASSRGRGIYLVSNPSQISMDDNVLISRYINNPLLIDNFKFDVRLYVLVTSYDPVIIYLYEEGLARFATVKYEQSGKHIKNQFMHLTNYSVNKKSSDYVSCDDPDVEDYGNKWSMSAMLRYLRQQGMDTTLLMGQIEDLVIKTLLSVELQIATACKMFVPFKTNCFELYGFDVLIDSNLKPWLLEVNLSPSLACDSPLDLKIKASMIADMFSLIGVVCQDPLMRSLQLSRAGHDPNAKGSAERFQRPLSGSGAERRPRRRQAEVGVGGEQGTAVLHSKKKQEQGEHGTVVLSTEEVKTLRRIQDEYERRGGFIRIFPTSDTWDLYSGFLEYKTNMNSLLATRLFPESSRRRGSASLGRLGCQSVHVVQYERKLLSLQARTHRKRRRRNRRTERGCKEAVSSAEEEGEEAEEVLSIEGGGGGGGGGVEKKRATSAPAPSAPQEEEQQRDKAHVVVRHFAQKDIRTSASAHASASSHQASSHQASSHQASAAQATRRPRVNLLYVLQQGWQLSKVQARVAFSCYLQRVQSRLLSESKLNSASPWPEKDNEQMELIIRFLKRAASNLQEEIQMDLPSSQLPLQDRCHILSHQLAQFIRCYDKETQLMEQELEKSKDGHFINPSVFQDFIAKASETDLEKVLTFYTLDSRSPSVFLGTRERSSKPEQSKAPNSSCSGQGEPARVSHHAKWCARPAAGMNKLQEIRDDDGKEMDVARIKDAYESLQASGGLKRDTTTSSATKVQPQVLHVTASSHMMQGDTSSGQTRRVKPGDGVGVAATATAVSATVSKSTPLLKKANEADASTASRGQHKIITKSSNSAAATAANSNSGPKVGRWCAALPQSAGHLPYSYHKLATSTYSPLIPLSNTVIGPPVYNMATIANRSAAQTVTCSTLTNSSAVLQPPPPQGTGAATGSSSVTEVTSKTSSSSLPTPLSTIPLYGKTTSYPTPPERPKSSTAPRHGPGVALKDAVLSRYDQKVITSALQNLIEKQAARHSGPSASISMLTQKMANFNLANAIPKKDSVDPSQSLPKALSLHKWPMRSLYSDSNLTQTHSARSAQDHTSRVGGPGHSEVGVGVGVGGVKSPAGSALLPRDASPAPSYQLHFAIQQLQQQRRRPGQFLTQSHNRHQVRTQDGNQ